MKSPELLLWQLADSAFPSGGFAHSGGLEAAWRQGHIKDAAALAAFIRDALWQTVYNTLPFIRATYEKPAEFAVIDARCDAVLSNHVANRASRAQGQAMLAGAARIFHVPALQDLLAGARLAERPLHWAPVMGVIGRALELGEHEVLHLGIFITQRGFISSAVRLGIVGPMQGQTIQFNLADEVEPMATRAMQLVLDDVAQTDPLLEILQSSHDRLYSRLFHS